MKRKTRSASELLKSAGSRLAGVLQSPLHLASRPGRRYVPAQAPGIESLLEQDHADVTVDIACIDYSADRLERKQIDDLDEFLGEPQPDWVSVRWLQVTGHKASVVDQLRRHYGFHTLASEDALNIPQRPKLDDYGDHLFAVVRTIEPEEGTQQLHSQQMSVFCKPGLVVTFLEHDSILQAPIEARIRKPESRFRNNGSSYLLYALLDAVVDYCFPMLEGYADELEDLEHRALTRDDQRILNRLYGIKRDLVQLRRLIWPMREVAENMRMGESPIISEHVQDYSRDLLDHALQLIDIVSTLRDSASSLTDLVLSLAGNRMNEVMKVLTIMASLFIPVTFLAGVYGMNFEHIPELSWEYAYPAFWAVCSLVTIGLLIYFRRKRWL